MEIMTGKMNKNIYIWILALVLIVSSVSAQLIYKSGQEIDIKIPCFNNGTYCSAATMCNLTSSYPNSTIFINNLDMTNQRSYHNYTIDAVNSNVLGSYFSSMICNDNGNLGKYTFEFKITGNGKDDPDGIVIVLFIVGFVLILFYLIFILLYGIGAFSEFNFDIMDLAYNWGGYFAFLALFMLEKFYLGNLDIESMMVIFISVGGVTNGLVPIIMFFVSMIKKMLERKKLGEG